MISMQIRSFRGKVKPGRQARISAHMRIDDGAQAPRLALTSLDGEDPDITPSQGDNMIRFLAIVCLLMLVGCADESRGTALNEGRMKHYLDSITTQSEAIPDCMRARSFPIVIGCTPTPDEREWDRQVRAFAYDNPQCYRPAGSSTWFATALSPM